jgi:hypothetical protein
MEQLLLHLIGDYITQTDWMARHKRASVNVAWIHALVYGLPFLLITQSIPALLLIIVSHALIDNYGLARYVVFAKNWLTDRSLTWAECSSTGYPPSVPQWMAVWLLIIADNTLHLCINYAAIRWL